MAELRRLRTLDEENRKLEQPVAAVSLDKKMLQDVLSQNVEARGTNLTHLKTVAEVPLTVPSVSFVCRRERHREDLGGGTA